MENKNFKNLPIYQKAEEIGDLVQAFIATIPDDDAYLNSIGEQMNANAITIVAKIAGAEGGDYYDIRMQNAAIIRQAGMDLYVQMGSLRFQENYSQPEYIDLIREEIEVFRDLFSLWVANFDFTHFNFDDWGLFNPPHVKTKSPIDQIDWDKEDEENDREWDELDFEDDGEKYIPDIQ